MDHTDILFNELTPIIVDSFLLTSLRERLARRASDYNVKSIFRAFSQEFRNHNHSDIALNYIMRLCSKIMAESFTTVVVVLYATVYLEVDTITLVCEEAKV